MEDNKPTEINPGNNTETIFSNDEFDTGMYNKHIRQARNACFITAGLLLVNALFLFSKYEFDFELLWFDYMLWTVYIGGFVALGFWTNKKPYYAIIGALVLMGVFIVINAILAPLSIISFWIIKLAIIVTLVKGLQDAREAQAMKEQFQNR